MKNKLRLLLLTTLILGIALLSSSVMAGSKNQNNGNGKSDLRGTGKINGLNGCAPPLESGNYMIYMPSDLPPGWSHEWEGGPCCPSNIPSGMGNNYPLPNQCCNPPDYLPSPPWDPETPTGAHHPGNHCLCFEIRGWPIPKAIPPPS